jgi:hypothetical protein
VHAVHAVVVTAEGMPEPRRRAEQWYQQAPVADEVWEYYPARQASPEALSCVLDFEGRRLDLAELAFDLRVDRERGLLDVTVIHSAFAGMPEKIQRHAAALVLDWALGEDNATRWVKSMSTSGVRGESCVPVAGLTQTADALAERAATPRWLLLRGQRDGDILIATVRTPATWVDHPLLDTHFAVLAPFEDEQHGGLPGPGTLGQLRMLEDELTARLPPTALLAAHETARRLRTFHIYGDSDDPALHDLVQDSVSQWQGATVTPAADPGWQAIRHLTN